MSALDKGADKGHEKPEEFLVFRLGKEEYGIDILKVQEIRSYEEPTRIANSPPFMKGIINLRGIIVPILDLRLKLHCPSADYTEFTAVIIITVHGKVIGVVVDSVSDVLELTRDKIKPTPEMGSAIDTAYITGIASLDDSRMLILADIEALLSESETRA